jgi:glycosyltransferase involved in cell wall biosynthesis
MPVHNALPHLDQAVESILGQTYAEFEFVILDDASTDGSTERLRHWASLDQRIRLLEVDRNLGPVRSSNMVAEAARAPFVARMDADDISYPGRLAEELHLLRDDGAAGLVASLCDIIDTRGRKIRDAELWRLSRRSVFVPFPHGAIMYRREVFEQVGGYREECEYWEDQDLVMRMGRVSKVLVIPRPLYSARQSTTSTRIGSSQERMERALDREYRATDAVELSQDRAEWLDAAEGDPRKVDPRVFIAMGSVRLWAGRKPRLFRRFLERADMSPDLRTASALIWTAWASLSPSTLRLFLLFLLRTRNRLAAGRVPTDRPLLWHPLDRSGREASAERRESPAAEGLDAHEPLGLGRPKISQSGNS